MATFYNKEELLKAVESGAVSKTKHPTEDLWIYNYTRAAVRDSEIPWHSKTLRQCRGVITDANLNFVARPFEKFFNFEELAELPDECMPADTLSLPYTISEKIDGSLGIMYWTKDGPALATRSTFTSEQALHGTKILREKYGEVVKHLPHDKTFLFEIVYPENKLVVNYGDIDDLFLLAVIDTETGKEENVDGLYPGFLRPCQYVGDWRTIREKYTNIGEDKNKEGFVIRFSNGYRIKMKFAQYFKMHYLVGKLTLKHLLDIVSVGEAGQKELDEIREELKKNDEELLAYVDSEIDKLFMMKHNLFIQAKVLYRGQEEFPSMKEWSDYNRAQGDFRPILFVMNRLHHPDQYYVTQAMERRDAYQLNRLLWNLIKNKL